MNTTSVDLRPKKSTEHQEVTEISRDVVMPEIGSMIYLPYRGARGQRASTLPPIALTTNSEAVLKAQFFCITNQCCPKKKMVKGNPHGTTSLHMLGITRVILRSCNVDQLVKQTRV